MNKFCEHYFYTTYFLQEVLVFLVKVRIKIWQTLKIQMKLHLLKHLRIKIRKISVTLHGCCNDIICERQKNLQLDLPMQCMMLEIMNVDCKCMHVVV